MKLRSVQIQNFRGIRQLEFSLLDLDANPRNLTCIIGDNGSGKTTVLQAIALTLSLATRRIRRPEDFSWHGFLPERVASLGNSRVELEVQFSEQEIDLTQELFQRWYDAQPGEFRETRRITPPGRSPIVRLIWEPRGLTSDQGIAGMHQFLGRYYVTALRKLDPGLNLLYQKLGAVFWFDQYRNLGKVRSQQTEDEDAGTTDQASWAAGIENLRRFLVNWWAIHTSPNVQPDRDYLSQLQTLYQRIFPGRTFCGVEPRETDSGADSGNAWFLISSGDHRYDLAEMSSGEQAIFSLMYDFVRLRIHHSIVLIDELELHLHPPEQQRLLTSLRHIGADCQFLITTHSEWLTNAVPDELEVRLEGGVRCL